MIHFKTHCNLFFFHHCVAAPCLCEKQNKNYLFVLNPSVDYVHHERGDKLRVSDTDSVGRRLGEVHVGLLWAVSAGPGNSRGIIGPLSPALHGEGGLALEVNVRVDGVVFCRSGAHGEVF